MFGYKDGLSFEQYLDLLDKRFPDVSIRFVPKGSQDALGQKPGKMANGVQVDVEIDGNCDIGKITKGRIDNRHGAGYDEDAFIDDFVRNAVENIERNHSWGHLSNHGIEMVKKAQEQPLNWGDILRLKLGPFLSYQKELSRRRWNRHYGKPFLGNTTKCVEPVAVYADTSGSVGSADLARIYPCFHQ